MGVYQPSFDPDKDFVTAAPFRANGIAWGKGFPFDKSTVTERVLRLLYEGHKLVFADDPRAAKLLSGFHRAVRGPEPVPAAPAPTVADEENAKVQRLSNRHNKTKLLELAKGIKGIGPSMSKTQIATALVRSGRGDS